MPIFSFIAYPNDGEKENLVSDLTSFKECEVIPSDNEDIVVVVTDTESAAADKALQSKLNDLESLKHLSMVYGHREEHITDQSTLSGGVN